jgi:hypothetical protein
MDKLLMIHLQKQVLVGDKCEKQEPKQQDFAAGSRFFFNLKKLYRFLEIEWVTR